MVRGRSADPMAWVVLTALHGIGGLTLVGLGVVGEYVGRIYEQVKGRPIYVVKESKLAAGAAEGRRPERRAA